jgi:protocatechuate 3,4-dioxygenase beta subunit
VACLLALAACADGSGPEQTTATISGQVTDASNSQPIAGATVTSQPATSSATTDAQGNYALANVDPGGYTVSAAKTGYQGASTSVTVTAGQTATANLPLTLLATTGTIAGRVTDASNSQPIAGATVTTLPATATLTTDAQGNYTIPNVAPGGYTVNAAKSGYQNGSASATVVAGQTATANMAITPLPTTGTISGRVTDASNSQPIAGATVSTQPATASVTTDAQGNYTISNVAPDGYTVNAAKSGYQNGSASATVVAGQIATANIALTLLPITGTIVGTVTDAGNGQQVSGATVTTQPTSATVTTDAQGHYTIASVSPGSYTVTAAKNGYQSGSAAASVTAGQTTTADIALAQIVDYAGEWRGTTSQNLPVYFRVDQAGQIDSLTVRLRMNFPTFTCTATFPATPPITIASGRFDAFLSIPITNISTTLHGLFSSATAVSGTWDSFSQNWIITCGSIFAFGTGGTTLQAGSWTAQKQ